MSAPAVALEIYVMPLSRYLTRAFEPVPLLAGEERWERPREQVAPAEANARVVAIQHHMSASLAAPVAWIDEGEVAFAESMDVRVLHGLRSLAAADEYPRRLLFLRLAFRLLDDPRRHPSLRRVYEGEPTAYAHLMRHSDNRGFWIPAELAEPMECNEPQWWRIGSVFGLARELVEVNRLIAGLAVGDDRGLLQAGHDLLARAVATAAERRLPLIIEG
jgi:hypothetical protein